MLVIAAVIASAAAACGGSSSSSSSQGSVGATGSVSIPSVSVPSVSVSGGGGDDFCANAQAAIAKAVAGLAPVTNTSSGPEATKKSLEALQAAYSVVEQNAPEEIKPDLQVLLTMMNKLADAYAAANYDPSQAAIAILPLVNDPKVQQASQHLTAWAKTHCGL